MELWIDPKAGSGPSMPVWYKPRLKSSKYTPVRDPRVDIDWDVNFRTKFSTTPSTTTMLLPRGAAAIIERSESRQKELNELITTQFKELPSIASELAANGIPSTSMNAYEETDEGDLISAEIAEHHLNRIPYDPDPLFLKQMQARIDWERYRLACGPVHRVGWGLTDNGQPAIWYKGLSKNKQGIDDFKRYLKTATIERYGGMPTPEAIASKPDRAIVAVQTILTEEQRDRYLISRHSLPDPTQNPLTSEDPDPERCDYHAEDLRGKIDTGYAGPVGLLGVDDDDPNYLDNTPAIHTPPWQCKCPTELAEEFEEDYWRRQEDDENDDI